MLVSVLLAPLAAAAETCPATPAALPASPLFAQDDPRLAAGTAVVIEKELRLGMVFVGGRLATDAAGAPACWHVALAAPYVAGHKRRQGDHRTPEGWYRLSDRPWSAFPHALTVHYPAPADAVRGLAASLIDQAQHDAILAAATADVAPPESTRLGGQILLHGGGGAADWTLGCVGFDDDAILTVRALLTPDLRGDVLILP
ncbi:MAG: L,D-transpeptidase family protein [Myxococcota bacterium]